MKNLRPLLAGVALALVATASQLPAQNTPPAGAPPGGNRTRGNFDPAEFRTRMLERLREQFDVKDDAEWKLISERMEKVFTAQRDARSGGGFGFSGRSSRGGDRPPGDRPPGERPPGDTPSFFRGEPNPDAEALQKALEAKAPAAEIKTKLAKFRESRKEREAKLEKAQEDLRQVLSARQEAQAVMMGLLK